MGTPTFAATILKAICSAGHEVALVLTQPDKPKGRGKILTPGPVKVLAQSYGIECLCPKRLSDPGVSQKLQDAGADMFIIAAYGQILSREILYMPKFGCVNIHASLLPRYRGASPIAAAILNGDKVTGISLMQMDEGLDTGDILASEELPIDENDCCDSLTEKLAALGAQMTADFLHKVELICIQTDKGAWHSGQVLAHTGFVRANETGSAGGTVERETALSTGFVPPARDCPKTPGAEHSSEIVTVQDDFVSPPAYISRHFDGFSDSLARVKQDDSKSVYAAKVKKGDGLIRWDSDAGLIERMSRAYEPWPGCYTYHNGRVLKLSRLDVLHKDCVNIADVDKEADCGTIVKIDKDYIIVKCGTSFLGVKEIQPEGKRRMSAGEFLRGYRIGVGDRLGDEKSTI